MYFIVSSPSKHISCIGTRSRSRLNTEKMGSPNSSIEMCERIRERRTAGVISSSPIFFRSKLSHPLSPTTPLLLIDILVEKHGDHIDRGVYASFYDFTHRYDCKSKWIDRLLELSLERSEGNASKENIVEGIDKSTINNVSDLAEVSFFQFICLTHI